jgi:hypothetical protein
MVVVYGLVLIIHHFFGIYLEYIRLVELNIPYSPNFPEIQKEQIL